MACGVRHGRRALRGPNGERLQPPLGGCGGGLSRGGKREAVRWRPPPCAPLRRHLGAFEEMFLPVTACSIVGPRYDAGRSPERPVPTKGVMTDFLKNCKFRHVQLLWAPAELLVSTLIFAFIFMNETDFESGMLSLLLRSWAFSFRLRISDLDICQRRHYLIPLWKEIRTYF